MNNKIAELKAKLAFGVSPAMATPLKDEGYQVNTAVLPALVNFLISQGVSGLFVGGTTGEGILLGEDERKILHSMTMTAVNGRVPVLLHIGANQTKTAVSLARHAEQISADAIIAITPTFYGMDDDSLIDYFSAVAEAAPQTPLFLYDIPHMAINGVSPALLGRLAESLPTLAGVKTSRPDAQIVRQLIDTAAENLIILAGNERIALGLMSLGAHGLISGLSTAVPEPFVALTAAVGAGDLTAARMQQQIINQLLNLVPSQRRIGAIKSILIDRGVPVGPPVPPRAFPPNSIWPTMEPLLK